MSPGVFSWPCPLHTASQFQWWNENATIAHPLPGKWLCKSWNGNFANIAIGEGSWFYIYISVCLSICFVNLRTNFRSLYFDLGQMPQNMKGFPCQLVGSYVGRLIWIPFSNSITPLRTITCSFVLYGILHNYDRYQEVWRICACVCPCASSRLAKYGQIGNRDRE